ncbi:MAG: prephenate dehydrogenase [Clostridia bacterium]|nr:prephenate dehydrogenase [Clostridia bacterium]
MKIAVAGLGLIGGSLAKAFGELPDIEVLGYDIDNTTIMRAKLVDAIDGVMDEKNIKECDYIFVALYPKATKEFLEKFAPYIRKNTVVVDCAGTKRSVCECGFKIAKENGFCFIGGHPMAGTQFSGFKYSRASLFDKASMILVPDKNEKLEILQEVKELLVKAGFKSVTITSAAEHDRIIAYTSQLAHVVSNAYVKSPNARVHKGFSAGSYRDLTRVARLNSSMWAELFLDNSENIAFEIDTIIEELSKYSKAIKENDRETLTKLLDEGTIVKESIG